MDDQVINSGLKGFVYHIWESIANLVGWDMAMKLKNLSDEIAGFILGYVFCIFVFNYLLSKVTVSPKLNGTDIVAMRVEHHGKREILVPEPRSFMDNFMVSIAIFVVRFYPNATLRLSNVRKIQVSFFLVSIVLFAVVVFGFLTGVVIIERPEPTPP